MKKKRTIIIISSLAVVLIALIFWTVWGDTALRLSAYTIADDEIPNSFDGYKIAQVSDLHNAQFGNGNEELLNMLKTTNVILNHTSALKVEKESKRKKTILLLK